MSDIKYYVQQNAQQHLPVQAGNYKVQFDVVAFFSGQWWGIFATDKPELIEALDKTVGTQGVMPSTQEDFEAFAKKKGTRQTHTWSMTESVSGERPSPTPQLKENSAVSVETSPDPMPDEPAKNHSMDDLLQTKPREDSPSINNVSSQSALAEHFGMSLPKLREFAAIEGAPAKTVEGYNIPQWEAFINQHRT